MLLIVGILRLATGIFLGMQIEKCRQFDKKFWFLDPKKVSKALKK